MITDCKLLVVIFNKDDASLSHRPQRIVLRLHQYSIRILLKSGPQLFITDWLSRDNQEGTSQKEIPGMCIIIIAIALCMDIPGCITAEK